MLIQNDQNYSKYQEYHIQYKGSRRCIQFPASGKEIKDRQKSSDAPDCSSFLRPSFNDRFPCPGYDLLPFRNIGCKKIIYGTDQNDPAAKYDGRHLIVSRRIDLKPAEKVKEVKMYDPGQAYRIMRGFSADQRHAGGKQHNKTRHNAEQHDRHISHDHMPSFPDRLYRVTVIIDAVFIYKIQT